MATNRKPEPEPNPPERALAEEVAAIFEADPEFKERLRATVERVRAGKERLVEDAEVRRRLRERGVWLDDADPGGGHTHLRCALGEHQRPDVLR